MVSIMTFQSILFDQEISKIEKLEQPEYFNDLLLDKVIDAIISPKKDYNLKPYFYFPLQDNTLIKFRTEVFKDLENQELFKIIDDFSQEFLMVRHGINLVLHLESPFNKMGWYLDSVLIYCKALTTLSNNLEKIMLNSKGLNQFREYLIHYINSSNFEQLYSEASKVKDDLLTINYTINVQSGSFTVQKYKNEKDYSSEVLNIFEKFRQKKEGDFKVKRKIKNGMNHVESLILDYVVNLFPEPFMALKRFYNQFSFFVDDKIKNFDREIQFYIAYLQFMAKIEIKGLKFCYPDLTTAKQEIYNNNSFDIALALKLMRNDEPIILNDFYLEEPERIMVVSGPNQGGKTTFARIFGQVHYLTRLGVAIPGTKAKIFISDKIFTHFEKEESVSTLQGKLLDELTRIKVIISQLTSNSIVIMNEIFNSTTLDDAIFLGKNIMEKLLELGVFCVVVTFIDEISKLGPSFVSMVSNIVPENPTMRTFKIIRKPADGLAYALVIAKKHQLTYSQIKERILF